MSDIKTVIINILAILDLIEVSIGFELIIKGLKYFLRFLLSEFINFELSGAILLYFWVYSKRILYNKRGPLVLFIKSPEFLIIRSLFLALSSKPLITFVFLLTKKSLIFAEDAISVDVVLYSLPSAASFIMKF